MCECVLEANFPGQSRGCAETRSTYKRESISSPEIRLSSGAMRHMDKLRLGSSQGRAPEAGHRLLDTYRECEIDGIEPFLPSGETGCRGRGSRVVQKGK